MYENDHSPSIDSFNRSMYVYTSYLWGLVNSIEIYLTEILIPGFLI